MEKIMLYKPVTVLSLLFIFFIHLKKYVNCSIRVYLTHNHLRANLVLEQNYRFQALIVHALLDRSIPFLYQKSACTSGSICRKRILFISRFGAIVSHFIRGDIFFTHPVVISYF